MKFIQRSSFFLFFILLMSCAHKKATIPEKNLNLPLAWVEVGPSNQMIVRAISQNADCPTLLADQALTKMTWRTGSNRNFPVQVCEASLPPDTKKATIAGEVLAIPKKNPTRIAILADTGCRIKSDVFISEFQNCNDPNAWPFQKITEQIAEWKPDLVIHVGDYLYRESACPMNNKNCEGSPFGDNWATWEADFFYPAQKLLRSAPWVFVRGNHELCSRAGKGWFTFLDPFPYSSLCTDFTDPYPIKFDNLELIVFDVASADDMGISKEKTKRYSQQFNKINSFNLSKAWLLNHRPIWFATPKGNSFNRLNQPQLKFQNEILQSSFSNYLSSNIKLILSGHVHLVEAVTFADSGPSAIISGNGGTALLPERANLNGVQINNRKVQSDWGLVKFGFFTFELLDKNRWLGLSHDLSGQINQKCLLEGSTLNCSTPQTIP